MHRRLALFAAPALAPLAALAAPEFPEYDFARSRDRQSFELTTENDVFGLKKTDRYYTNGFKAGYVSPALNDDKVWTLRAHLGVAQEMYTPADTHSLSPSPDDHPYSGWLYGMAGFGWEDESSLDLLTVRVGVVGPSALGRQVQNAYHDLINIGKAEGWNQQLEDELGVDIEWKRVWRIRLAGESDGWSLDMLPRLGCEFGTVRNYGATGVQFRFGNNLPADFGVRLARDSAVDGAPTVAGDYGFLPNSFYVFAELQGEGWIRNMAIDGNISHSGPRVALEPWVGQCAFGVALQWGGLKLTATEAIRTAEFTEQSDGVFSFGSLTASIAW